MFLDGPDRAISCDHVAALHRKTAPRHAAAVLRHSAPPRRNPPEVRKVLRAGDRVRWRAIRRLVTVLAGRNRDERSFFKVAWERVTGSVALRAPPDRMHPPRWSGCSGPSPCGLLPIGGTRPVGAGDRDRTGTTSLEGWGSTIELHPRTCPLRLLAYAAVCDGRLSHAHAG